MRRPRADARYSSLTSLLDVLFILLFAALIHAAASVERAHGESAAPDEAKPDERTIAEPATVIAADAAPADEPDAAPSSVAQRPPGDAGPAEPSREQIYEQALAELARGIGERSVTYARVSAGGVLVSLEREQAGAGVDAPSPLALGVPLLERVPDPDKGLVYLGERIDELRICTIARRHLGRDNLDDELVIVVPEVPLADLEVALVRGLRRDQERCLRDEGALAVVVDPLRAMQQP